jgi:hypothetical protein
VGPTLSATTSAAKPPGKIKPPLSASGWGNFNSCVPETHPNVSMERQNKARLIKRMMHKEMNR